MQKLIHPQTQILRVAMQLRQRLDDPFASKVRVNEVQAMIAELKEEYNFIVANKHKITGFDFL